MPARVCVLFSSKRLGTCGHLKGMNNTAQTKLTAVHFVLAERASPKCQELTLCPFSFSLLCTSATSVKFRLIMVKGVREDEGAEVKEQRGSDKE